MKKSKKYYIVVMLLISIFLLVGCSSTTEKNVVKGNDVKIYNKSPSRPFAITVSCSNKENATNCETEQKVSSVIIRNDKVIIEVRLDSYVYNTYANYKAKYGNKETNYKNYIEYLEDKDFDGQKIPGQIEFQKTKISGLEAITYEYNNDMFYYLNNSNFYKDSAFKIVISPKDKSYKVTDLLNDEEVKALIDSIKVSDYKTE